MTKKVKDVILAIVIALMGAMIIVGLVAPLAQVEGEGVNSFDFLQAWVDEMSAYGAFLFVKIAIIATIVLGALTIVLGASTLFVNKPSIKFIAMGMAALGAILNLVAGIFYVGICKEMYGAECSTLAFIGLIMVVVLSIAYFIVSKFIKTQD